MTGAEVGAAPADPAAMRAARRRWAGGVAVVLTADGDGFRGAAVSAFAVLSLDPGLVLVGLDREGRMATAVPAAGAFTVSVLDRRQEVVAERFAGRAPLVDPRLTGVPHRLLAGGLPVLDGALAWFACRVREVHEAGDHRIVVGAVQTVGLGPDTDDPLLYYEGHYRGIEAR